VTQLPRGWIQSTISDLVSSDGVFVDGDWVETKDQDPDGEVRLVQLADVGDGTFLDRSSRFLTATKAVVLRCTMLREKDILIARMPHPLGRACIFPGSARPCVTVVDVCIVRPGSVGPDPRWLMHIINAPQMRSAIALLQSGSTRQRISRTNLARIRIPVPPVPEQLRIVAEVDRHFSNLAQIDGILRSATRRVHLLRGAVVLRQLGQLCHHQLYPLCKFGDLIADVGGGTTQPPIDERTDWPILRSSSVRTLAINWSDVRYLRVPPSAENAKLRFGDVLFTRLNGSIEYVANCATVGDLGLNSFFFPDRLFRVRLRDGICPDYIAVAFASPSMRQQIGELTRSSAGHQRISISDLKRFVLPLPPHTAQVEIAEEASRILSVLSVLMTDVSNSLSRAAVLRQAILKKAFEGKLVPQDPDDEPASILLERIRAACAQTPARRAPRKREVHA
jgi:type I restriction enzyme S subunit